MMPGAGSNYQDPNAPAMITSKDITHFEVSGDFEAITPGSDYNYVYAYASKVSKGVLTAVICRDKKGETVSQTALVEETVLPELQRIVEKYGFVKGNGRSHFANGLPKNFGGRISVDYASGEYIFVEDNQSAVISPAAGKETADVLKGYIAEKSRKLPDSEEIAAVTYAEDRDDGTFHHIRLEGSKLVSEAKYGPGENQAFRNEKTVSEEAMEKLRRMADEGALLGWSGLKEKDSPMNRFLPGKVIFTLRDGSEYCISERMPAPGTASNSVFSIKTYLMNDLGQ